MHHHIRQLSTDDNWNITICYNKWITNSIVKWKKKLYFLAFSKCNWFKVGFSHQDRQAAQNKTPIFAIQGLYFIFPFCSGLRYPCNVCMCYENNNSYNMLQPLALTVTLMKITRYSLNILTIFIKQTRNAMWNH